MSEPIKVLVVDDSATMRVLIRRAIETDPGLAVIGEAADPIEARAAIKALNPHVVTLDIEMPNMNGIEFLERLMRLRPTPVIMVSTLTQKGADATLLALERGAVDCIGKPITGGLDTLLGLPAKIRMAALARVGAAAAPAGPAHPAGYAGGDRMIAIGASTGGVEALLRVLGEFPANCPPTVVTQHMPAAFTGSFAQRLNRHCAPTVAEATDGAPLLPGRIYLAPGDRHLRVTNDRCRLDDGPPRSGHRPSVDVMFDSVAAARGSAAVGVILTGMGRDGAEGLLAMRRAGAATIGQDEATSVVFGMPKSAADAGAVEKQLPLGRIAPSALAAASSKAPSTEVA